IDLPPHYKSAMTRCDSVKHVRNCSSSGGRRNLPVLHHLACMYHLHWGREDNVQPKDPEKGRVRDRKRGLSNAGCSRGLARYFGVRPGVFWCSSWHIQRLALDSQLALKFSSQTVWRNVNVVPPCDLISYLGHIHSEWAL